MGKTKQSPPWSQYVGALTAMFEKDPEIDIKYSDEDRTVSLYVDNQNKADALGKLLPESVEFGNVTLKINIIPSNEDMTPAQLFETAFSNNPALVKIVEVDDVFTTPLTYVVFKKEVVQFFTDNLGDIHGNRTTLYQEIADEVFTHHAGVLYCTDNGLSTEA